MTVYYNLTVIHIVSIDCNCIRDHNKVLLMSLAYNHPEFVKYYK